MSDLARELQDYRLTIAEILYHLPDHPALLQSFTWQTLDLSPHFPVLRRFLHFWESSIDGRLHSVRIARCERIGPAALRCASELRLH